MLQVFARNLGNRDQIETIPGVARFLSKKEFRDESKQEGERKILEHIQEEVQASPYKILAGIFF